MYKNAWNSCESVCLKNKNGHDTAKNGHEMAKNGPYGGKEGWRR